MVKITYFQPDGFKQGGHYITIVGNVSKIDEYERIIILEDYTKILINDIYQIELDFIESAIQSKKSLLMLSYDC